MAVRAAPTIMLVKALGSNRLADTDHSSWPSALVVWRAQWSTQQAVRRRPRRQHCNGGKRHDWHLYRSGRNAYTLTESASGTTNLDNTAAPSPVPTVRFADRACQVVPPTRPRQASRSHPLLALPFPVP